MTEPGEVRRRWLAAGLFGSTMLPARKAAADVTPLAGVDASRATVSFPGATTPIPLSDALKERCSLRSFGAKLDGATDDSAAVARAVAYARANNVPVFHPGGACLMAGEAAEIDTHGVAFVGVGMDDVAYPYGRSGSQFWITDTARSPFRLGGGGAFDGLVFFWPNQSNHEDAPLPYPPLFTAAAHARAVDISIRSCQVTNAFDFLEVSAPGTVAGGIFISDCRIFALRNCFHFVTVPEVLMIENNLFSYAVFRHELLRGAGGGKQAEGKFRLRDYTANQGCWFLLTGDGTPEKASSTVGGCIIASNNYVLGYRYGIRVQGGFCSIARLTSTHFDAVSTVLGVDPGGTLAGVQILGSLFYSFNAGDPQAAHPAFSIRDPSPDNHGNPVCRLYVTDCEFGFVSGAIFDIEGVNVSEVKISDCKLTRHAHTATPGTYHALRIAAPNAKLTFSNNDILPAGRFGTGIRIEAVKWASVTGNTFEGCAAPIELAGTAGRILLSANLSSATRGPRSVVGAGTAFVLDAANAWDKPAPPGAATR